MNLPAPGTATRGFPLGCAKPDDAQCVRFVPSADLTRTPRVPIVRCRASLRVKRPDGKVPFGDRKVAKYGNRYASVGYCECLGRWARCDPQRVCMGDSQRRRMVSSVAQGSWVVRDRADRAIWQRAVGCNR